ncbi:hypothetical protein JXB41_04145 [Candidatus Woesearchaeota archaeon]|nr:hypothetical protein [Candidatus Woesearchaeota archaeon]
MPSESPINIIRQMKQQGFSNNDIVQNLTREGYSNTQIFDAMNHIETKNAVENSQDDLIQMPPDEEFQTFNNNSQATGTADIPDNDINYQAQENEHFDPKTEELIETIIDEKWEDLLKDVNKIIEWKNRSEQRLQDIELKVQNLKESFNELHKAVIGKVAEYDKHILDVGTEIKAMEKVFSKVLPNFTENVHELARITDTIKKEKNR